MHKAAKDAFSTKTSVPIGEQGRGFLGPSPNSRPGSQWNFLAVWKPMANTVSLLFIKFQSIVVLMEHWQGTACVPVSLRDLILLRVTAPAMYRNNCAHSAQRQVRHIPGPQADTPHCLRYCRFPMLNPHLCGKWPCLWGFRIAPPTSRFYSHNLWSLRGGRWIRKAPNSNNLDFSAND